MRGPDTLAELAVPISFLAAMKGVIQPDLGNFSQISSGLCGMITSSSPISYEIERDHIKPVHTVGDTVDGQIIQTPIHEL